MAAIFEKYLISLVSLIFRLSLKRGFGGCGHGFGGCDGLGGLGGFGGFGGIGGFSGFGEFGGFVF